MAILFPRVTEKSTVASESGVYTFLIAPKANKHDVAKAVKKLFGVTPIKIAIVRLPAKTIMSRGRPGRKTGVKKAMVYLKKGDKITFV